MFGYIKPFKPNMRIKDYELYKAVYCSVCKDLGKNFGILSRFLLSYDATFLALILLSLEKNPSILYNKRCVVNPLKKCNFLNMSNNNAEIFFFVSAITVLLSYNKIIDDINDHRGLRKLLAKTLKVIYSRAYKKAKFHFPKEATIFSEGISKQSECEKKDISIDAYAHNSANMLSCALSEHYRKNSIKFRILSELGYHLGRWVYFIDAADDREKDKKLNNFNPLKNVPNTEILMILNQTLARIITAYDLLETNSMGIILENIISEGLPAMQMHVLHKKQYNLKGRKNNERSI